MFENAQLDMSYLSLKKGTIHECETSIRQANFAWTSGDGD